MSIGFWKKSKAPRRDRLQRVLALPLPGHHHDRRLRVALPHVAQQVEAFLHLAGRRQAHVEEVEVGLRGAEGAAVGRVAGRGHRETALERPGQLLEEEGVVLDDDDPPRGDRGLAHPASPAIAGSDRRMSVPPPGCERIRIVPRWNLTIWLAVERPRPTPSGFVVAYG